jgi:CHAT domain-containing protein
MKRRILLLLLLLAAGGLLVARATSAYRLARPAGALHDLVRARPVRGFAPRLSIPLKYRPCSRDSLPADGTVPRERCGENEDAPFDLEALAAAEESLDPDTLRAAALAAVMWWDGLDASLNRAVTRLEDARRLAPESAPVLVDLSGVYLVRAERTQNARDLGEALEAADEALALDSANEAALFNAALALQALAIDEGATSAWDAYLAADSTSRWAGEARRRRRALLTPAPRPQEPTTSSTAADVDTFAARDPQGARLLGWENVLGKWGSAVLEGDVPRADSQLRLAERLGAALKRRGGDATLADAVDAIRAARHDRHVTRKLARAHQAYAAGQAYFNDRDHLPARDSFAVVLDLQPPSPTLLAWTRLFHASTRYYIDRSDDGKAVRDSLLAETDSVRHPALLARVRWMTGTPLLRDLDFAAAREKFSEASAAFERLGETENFGTTRYLQGEAAYDEGDTLQAYGMLHRGLIALRPYRGSHWLHNALMELAKSAAADGMPLAAMRIQDEGFAVAMRTGRPIYAAEALLARARVRAIAGDTSGAMEDLDAADPLVDTLGIDYFTHTLRFSRAVVSDPGTNGSRYAAELDSAVRYFARENEAWLLPTYMRRADLRLAAGDREGADADLDRITARIRTLSRSEADFHLRLAMIEQARNRFDQRVMLYVRDGRPREALQALERGRISFASGGGERVEPVGRPLVPPSQFAVAYALIGDTLLTWTVNGDSVRLLERLVDRDTLLFAIRQAGAALETPERAALAEPHLRRLYEWLIRPVQSRLGPPETRLNILADGEIAGVPFAALRDTRGGPYLIQDHPLRFVASLADAALPPPVPAAAATGVLLVADPAFDPAAHPMLDRLAGADAEVESLRSVYPGAHVLRGHEATAAALAARARGASIIHFAGHALFDDTRPEQSSLVLAGEDRLTAKTAGLLELGGVRMVVLSACRTMRSRGGRSDGMAGLAGALLSAGAGGVVGSLWEVDDRRTQPLMLAFHRHYARSGDPAGALRQAQLAMLNSPDSVDRSPASWAAFRYIGR